MTVYKESCKLRGLCFSSSGIVCFRQWRSGLLVTIIGCCGVLDFHVSQSQLREMHGIGTRASNGLGME